MCSGDAFTVWWLLPVCHFCPIISRTCRPLHAGAENHPRRRKWNPGDALFHRANLSIDSQPAPNSRAIYCRTIHTNITSIAGVAYPNRIVLMYYHLSHKSTKREMSRPINGCFPERNLPCPPWIFHSSVCRHMGSPQAYKTQMNIIPNGFFTLFGGNCESWDICIQGPAQPNVMLLAYCVDTANFHKRNFLKFAKAAFTNGAESASVVIENKLIIRGSLIA